MDEFFRRILRWLGALRAAFASIFQEEQEEPRRPAAGPGIEEVEKGAFKPGELALGSTDKPVYEKSKSLLSFRERELYGAICTATQGEYAVLMKVRMGDFVWLRNEPQDRKYFNNQVLCKHVDFLLCDKNTLKPLLVIELDDSSHIKSGYTIDSDKFKDDTFAAIGMPMLRIKVRQRYDCGELRSQIQMHIGHSVARVRLEKQ